MIQSKVKIINKKTKVVSEVKASIAGDFIGTGEFELYNEEKEKKEETKGFNFKKSE